MRFFLAIFLSCASITLSAQRSFESYGTKQGLSNQQVNCIYQDSRGFIWIGTNFGLNFFTGTGFVHYYNIPSDTNSLPNNIIRAITEDGEHRLWIGTQKGVSCFDLLEKKFINYSPIAKGGRNMDIAFCHVFVAHDGIVWIGHDKGIIALNPLNDEVIQYPVQLKAPVKFANQFVSHFIEDAEATIWAATSYGIYAKKKNSKTFILCSPPDQQIESYQCTKFTMDKDSVIYCGTWNKGILYKPKKAEIFEPVANNTEIKNHTGAVFDLLFDKDSTVWLTTIHGLFKTNISCLNDKRNFAFQQWLEEKHNFPSNLVSGLFKDNAGRIWVAGENGYSKINPGTDFIQHLSFADINTWSPISLLQSGDEEVTILNGLSLLSFNRKKEQFRLIYSLQNAPGEITKKDDHYWLTEKNGVWLLDNRLQKKDLFRFSGEGNEELSFMKVLEDKQGLLWLGTRQRKGICIYNTITKQWQHLLYRPGEDINLTGQSINDITEDSHGNVWLAAKQLVKFDRLVKKFEPVKISRSTYTLDDANSIRCLYTEGNKLWAGSDAGLYFIDLKTNQVQQVIMPAAISPQILHITADKQGTLWLITQNGLILYNPSTGYFKILSELNGLLTNRLSSITSLDDGTIMIGYDRGVSIIDPLLLPKTNNIPSPKWTEILIDNKQVPADQQKSVNLRYNQSIHFSFISPNYDEPSENQYAYQLEGIDKTWNYIGNNTSLPFPHLPAGNYSLRIKAGTADGIWNEEPTSFVFLVTPPFWKTWWFISLFLVTVLFIFYIIYRYRLQQVLKMERMRTRIATDLHDDIGATLSSISMYSEAVKNQVKEQLPHLEPVLNKMGENSRSMVSSMSDIVWAINPNNDDGQKLVQRMESYARDVCAIKDVQLHFSGDESLNDIKLPLEHRKNIYLVFKEALNNALKYSQASEIAVRISRNNHELQLCVKDNGKGFNTTTAGKGNGLKNMLLRAKEINSELKIISAENAGTSIELICHV